MSEHDGVLRVVSQRGGGWPHKSSDEPKNGAEDYIREPVVQTFRIGSLQDVRLLGQTTLTLPRRESLMSVRFDGSRAYVVTYAPEIRRDPLFIVDLSDPERPTLRGEVELAGWLYHMEPRGDRLVAVGFDEQRETPLAVSLFDVQDPDQPRLLSRVSLGERWGELPEDPDRIHKALRLLPDEGLILLPYAGWDQSRSGCGGQLVSGVQMIDWDPDELRARAVVPHHGVGRRSFVHRERLVAVSDERVESFDVADRDRPELLDTLFVAHTVYAQAPVGEHLVELVADWWTTGARLDVVPIDAPNAAKPVASLDLADVLRLSGDGACEATYVDPTRTALATHGSRAYLLWERTRDRTGLAAFDLRDPTAPVLLGRAELRLPFPEPLGWQWKGRLGSGEAIAVTGDALLLKTQGPVGALGGAPHPGAWLYPVDVSDPTRIQLGPALVPPGEHEPGLLHVVDGRVFSHHSEPIEGRGWERAVRFYLDEWDLSEPRHPHLIRSTNVPGTPVRVDLANSRLLSVDYQWRPIALPPGRPCGQSWPLYGEVRWDEDGSCWGLMRSLDLVELLDDGGARRLDQVVVEGAFLRDVQASDEAIFMNLRARAWGHAPPSEVPDPRARLITFSAATGDELVQQGEVRLQTETAWLYAAHDSSAVVLHRAPLSCNVYDASDPSDPTLALERPMAVESTDMRVVAGQFLSASARWGVLAVDLRL